MTTPPVASRFPRLRLRHWLLLGFLAALVITVHGIAGMLRVGRDAAALRDSVRQQTEAVWERKIEVAVGPIMFGLARFGLSFIELPPEARAALRAVRGAEVGVYDWEPEGAAGQRLSWLPAADRAMAARGCERVVAVSKGYELAAIYMPINLSSPSDFKISLMVLKDQQMVVVTARGDLEPLLEIVDEKIRCAPEMAAARSRFAALSGQ